LTLQCPKPLDKDLASTVVEGIKRGLQETNIDSSGGTNITAEPASQRDKAAGPNCRV
jgi:hypothetical protein